MKKIALVLSLLLSSAVGFADDSPPMKQNFFYVGGIVGVGDVDWNSTVAQDFPTAVSSIWSADGTGGLFGADAGYQFSRHFAIEAETMKMPNTTLVLSAVNLYNANTVITSHMMFSALIFKIMAPLPDSKISLFTDFGPAYQYRTDDIKYIGTFAPTFGGGFMYRVNNHWQVEGSFQYAPGTGKSVDDPLYFYVPEIYAGTFKINYIF